MYLVARIMCCSNSLWAAWLRVETQMEARFFQTCPDLLQAPPSLLYNGYWVSFQGVKQLGVGLTPPPSFSAEVGNG